jgi:Putative peptidoglycan binding domain
MTPVRERDTLIKRLIVVLAMVAGFFVVLPTEPASALPSCQGATRFSGSKFPAGPVSIPTVDYGLTDWDCTMTVGAHNYGVYWLQIALIRCYGQNIAADAEFGWATQWALANAQRIHRIPDDGVYGPQTRRTIMWRTEYNTCAKVTWA